ncbi:sensor histidine kinase [Leptospira brenneri]|uniref:sensor histidine kinase n=1 Tax=Leptospira brenneri TaxID=2023182 RepID=UPI000C2B3D6E|nr:sensor histidine kinase [Leptospira brenneri]PJZ44118.1 hypothetical protein CH361_17440 [Leptospira brenneri]
MDIQLSRRIVLFFLSVFLCSGCTTNKDEQVAPTAKNGFLDLTSTNVNSGLTIPLSGEWKFYWNQFILPRKNAKDSNDQFIFKKSPSVWNDTEYFGTTVGSFGYASYELDIKLSKDSPAMAMYIPDIGTAYELYINGELLSQAGIVSKTANNSKAQYRPQIITLPNIDHLNIIIHVSNYQNLWGGYWYPIQLGKVETIFRERQIQSGLSIAVCIAAGMMACYNLIFYIFRRKDTTPILFEIHCILILLRALTTGERIGHLAFDFLSWEILNRIEYFSTFCSGPVLYTFLYRFIPNEFWKKYGFYFNFPLYTMCVLILTTPNTFYAIFLNPLLFYIFFTVIPGWMIMILIGVFKKQKGAWVLLMGYFGLMVANVNDSLVIFGLLNSFYMIPYGQIFLIISHSIIISKRYSNSLTESENISHQMKTLVTSTQKIMSSPDYTSAAKSALEILSENNKDNKELYIFLPDTSGKTWKRYSIDTKFDLKVTEVSDLIEDRSSGLEFNRLKEPIILNDRLFLPITQKEHIFLILDIPAKSFTRNESDMDWVQGIAYALTLSLQNLMRQDINQLAIIGELTSEIAHDIGHHVLLIQKSLQYIELNPTLNFTLFKQAKKEIEALSNLSVDILEFSKKRIFLDLKLINAKDFFSSVEEDLILLFENSDIKLNFQNLSSDWIKIDELRMRRVCLNIAKNCLDLKEEVSEFSVLIQSENSALIIIMEDDGPGINDNLKDIIFNTKLESSKPQGTGLGLSIVRKIANAHGGEILLTSNPKGGTRFSILLPLS